MANPGRKILILGGTLEARELAGLLSARGFAVTTSLAGVTRAPSRIAGQVRLGGFGGTAGLRGYLQEERIALLADATHPFAAQISSNGAAAAAALDLPYLRLERPPWRPTPGDDWRPAADVREAAAMIPPGATALVTVGRKEIGVFCRREDIRIVARMIEPPDAQLPDHATLLLARPPFTLEQERDWLRSYGIDVLVAKNSGGAATEAKLAAASECKLPVIMIERPEKPLAETAASAQEMADRIAGYIGSAA